MVNITINNRKVSVPDGSTIMEAAKLSHISIPHLCYLKDINEIGACRVCVVEVEGIEKLITSCNNVVQEGMVIRTNSPKVRATRRINVQLLLSQHNARCAECTRSGNCSLQSISNDLGILDVPYHENLPAFRWNTEFPLIRDAQKCIKCMRCVQICDKVQSMRVWDISQTGSRTTVDVSGNRLITEADCTICGQCITHCPVGALYERDDVTKVLDALENKEKIVVASLAPAVRASWGESLGLKPEEATTNRLVAALKSIGFDYVFDTDFAADLTIMEEGSEFIEKIKNAENEKFPLFTSCCPGWVRFMKTEYPEMVDMLSTAKSPQQMFGAILKSWYAKLLNVDPSRLYCVSIMPCTAKKYECAVSTMNSSGRQDVDVVLTVREIDRLIKSERLDVRTLPEESFDLPLGLGTGAGVIFGATGGVMEAALRSAHYLITGQNPDPDSFVDVRGMKGWKEAKFDIAGKTLNVAVASGLGNARKLMDAIKNKEVSYDFVEVMACPGGCAGGGGQPIHDGVEMGEARGNILYGLDKVADLRFSHENPSIAKCYADFLDHPLSEKSHHLLHTDQNKWELW